MSRPLCARPSLESGVFRDSLVDARNGNDQAQRFEIQGGFERLQKLRSPLLRPAIDHQVRRLLTDQQVLLNRRDLTVAEEFLPPVETRGRRRENLDDEAGLIDKTAFRAPLFSACHPDVGTVHEVFAHVLELKLSTSRVDAARPGLYMYAEASRDIDCNDLMSLRRISHGEDVAGNVLVPYRALPFHRKVFFEREELLCLGGAAVSHHRLRNSQLEVQLARQPIQQPPALALGERSHRPLYLRQGIHLTHLRATPISRRQSTQESAMRKS